LFHGILCNLWGMGIFMKKIEAIIRPGKLEEIKNSLIKFDFNGLTISQVMGCGLQKGRKEYYRGTEVTLNLLPKIKIEIVTKDKDVDEIIRLLSQEAKTGEVGDGKIFVYNVEEAIRIRTGETGENAI
jgi:nitrogen regulatory protein P-II 1